MVKAFPALGKSTSQHGAKMETCFSSIASFMNRNKQQFSYIGGSFTAIPTPMRKIVFVGLLILFSLNTAFAANRYWVSISGGLWNNTANWSTSSGGASGASVPG